MSFKKKIHQVNAFSALQSSKDIQLPDALLKNPLLVSHLQLSSPLQNIKHNAGWSVFNLRPTSHDSQFPHPAVVWLAGHPTTDDGGGIGLNFLHARAGIHSFVCGSLRYPGKQKHPRYPDVAHLYRGPPGIWHCSKHELLSVKYVKSAQHCLPTQYLG